MGCFDYIEIECCYCHNEFEAQTKILGNNCLDTLKVGSKIENKELDNTRLELKNLCSCGKTIILKIENGIIKGTTKDNPTHVESHFGNYEKVEE